MQTAIAPKTSPGITITPYEHRFAQQVGELIVHIQQNEFGVPITYDDQPDLKNIPEFYQRNGGNFWVALTPTCEVVGTAALIDAGEGVGVLRKMFARHDHRSTKDCVGPRLLGTLLGWAGLHNFREIYLGTLDQLHAAHRFYEKNGFEKITLADLPECVERIRMKIDSKYYCKRLA